MKKINENTKVTLTLGQLKRLVNEASDFHFYEVHCRYPLDCGIYSGKKEITIGPCERARAFMEIRHLTNDNPNGGQHPLDVIEDGKSVMSEYEKYLEDDAEYKRNFW